MKVMVMAGGTGGHVFPGLAVADELRQRGHEVVWIGTPNSMESRLVPQHGLPIEYVSISGLRGKGVLTLLAAPFKLVVAVMQAMAILRRHRPVLVFGCGGFAAGPGGLAAWLLRRPLVIHEQNAVAGYTNRLLAQLAQRVLEAFPDTFPGEKHVNVVGNPVRSAILALAPPAQRLAARVGPVRILVLGGSLGAQALNQIVPQALEKLAPDQHVEIWHQGGRTVATAERAYAALAKQMGAKLQVAEFIQDMAAAYAWADLVICRAGALTVAEIAAVGLPAILVPFPHAVDDHQTANGRYLVEAGAALVIQERDLTASCLAHALQPLLTDRARLLRMAEAARARAWPTATRDIVDHCLAVAGVPA